MFRPKLFDTLQKYSVAQFTRDGLAGLVVGIVALPLAIAFAIASGATPDKGIYTAVIAGFIISALGGSRVQIGGPTGAFVIIVYGIIHQYGYSGLLLATIIAGIILVIFGIAKLGSVIKFIPHSVITGFTLGIALLIFAGQFSDFLGLGLRNLPADFIDKMTAVGEHLNAVNPYAVLSAVGTIVIIWGTGKLSPRLPGSLIALVAVALPVYYFNLPVETIGSRFGSIPHNLPSPSFPAVDLKTIRHLLNPAFSIAMLGAIESLLSAVVADGMIGGKHRSNTELVAQGVANIVTPLFGGLPATGAIARTATNIKNGGRTPVAGMVHAIVLLVIMLFFGPLVGYIPLACLAGILMLVAYHMSEWRSALSIMRISRGSALVMIVTFALTVFVDLTAAIEIGLIVSMFVFVRNMAQQTSVSYTLPRDDEERNEEAETDYANVQSCQVALPKGAVLYEINGPLFFGAVYKFREAMAEISRPPKVLILQLQQVPVIDSTGVRALQEAFKALRKKKTRFILCGMQAVVKERLERAGIDEYLSADDLCATLPDAVARAQTVLSSAV